MFLRFKHNWKKIPFTEKNEAAGSLFEEHLKKSNSDEKNPVGDILKDHNGKHAYKVPMAFGIDTGPQHHTPALSLTVGIKWFSRYSFFLFDTQPAKVCFSKAQS
ncbi:hypothetical protein ILYODFUR_003833 [Ilyodon furcidens]|uniref:Uncharacterized protein n=1 Tax=Ilyodon furcidens TaxID=33524 RepID=A0ABV0V005_9TELE